MQRRLYVRLFETWYTSLEHCDIGSDALAIGPPMMHFCYANEYGDGWARKENGQPIPVAVIAARAQMSVARATAALAKLETVGTVMQAEDGAWGFPNFGVYNPWVPEKKKSTPRVKKHREAKRDATDETRVKRVSPSVSDGVKHPALKREVEVEEEQSIEPFGFSPPSPPIADIDGESSRLATKPEHGPGRARLPSAEPTASPGAQVLTHPAAEPEAGRAAAQRRRAAAELWAWHEAERTRRLCAVKIDPRGHEQGDLNAIVRLLDHIRRRHGIDEAAAWARLRSFRERALAEAEEALRAGRVEYPNAAKQLEWARTRTAWSPKAYDLLDERGPDPRMAKAAADAEFAAEVARRKLAARNGGAGG